MDIIDHIAIKVSNLKEAEDWYLEHLKAQITFQDHKYTRLRVGNTNIQILIINSILYAIFPIT